ncbi:DUF3307 domain-containing protein [Fusobacterium necrophorum]|nr:DUF3307 domain-containing protein [Fusobacterium necrophorum]
MILIIFLISHILADYVFQTKNMAEKKKYSIKVLSFHAAIYSLVFFVTYLLLFQISLSWKSFLIIAVSHAVIDVGKEKVEAKLLFKHPSLPFFSFLLDQILHISILVFVLCYFSLEKHTNLYYQNIEAMPHFREIVSYILLFLVILTPSSVFIKKMFLLLFTETEEDSGTKAGNMIGKLERALIVILLLQNQYEAIGFVLAAKSIARFRQLDDKEFAEKYLVGTLASVLLALGATLLLKDFVV